MKTYIIQIAGAAILSVFADMFSPGGWKKYMGIITGIILMTVIVAPITGFWGKDVFLGYTESAEYTEQGTQIYGDMLKKEFSKSIAIDVRERIWNEFSVDTVVETEVETDENGNIERILKIIVSGNDLKQEIADRISYIYEVDEVILNDSR